MAVRSNRTSLKTIEAGLAKSLKANDASTIECGQWLIKAQKQLAHGEWLPWLNTHFPHSVDTAERWMSVARLIDKFCNLRNLKIAKTALYHLASKVDDLDGGIVSAIVKGASKTPDKWMNFFELSEILNHDFAARRLKQGKRTVVSRGTIADVTPIHVISRGTVSDTPISKMPSHEEIVQNTLANAVEKLDGIVSKSMRVLIAAKIYSEVLERVGQFLLDIVEARKSASTTIAAE
jgi:hypothetical protein